MKVLTINLIVVICLLVLSVSGQETNTSVCTNKAIEKVNSRGIKIGLKIDEVLSLFDLTEEAKQRIIVNAGTSGIPISGEPSRKTFGFKSFIMQPKPDNTSFNGISMYVFNFLDDRLVRFDVSYIMPQWKNVSHFGSTLIKFFNLPKIENWKLDGSQMSIECGNYFIKISASNSAGTQANNRLMIADNRTAFILKKREQKFIEEQREKDIKAFKP